MCAISHRKTISHLCDAAMKKANAILGYRRGGTFSRSREIVTPLYWVLVQPHLEYCLQYWSPILKKEELKLESVQRLAFPSLDHPNSLSNKERLRAYLHHIPGISSAGMISNSPYQVTPAHTPSMLSQGVISGAASPYVWVWLMRTGAGRWSVLESISPRPYQGCYADMFYKAYTYLT